ncbi:MAG: ATPase, partial [Acidobacteria bacterium]|nr:ATPase [Acidobacteriota bacterium]
RHKLKKAEKPARKTASARVAAHVVRPARFPVAGSGASAGGLEAFASLLAALPANPGVAFVFVQHLDPTHQSLLPEILSRPTRMPVMEAREGMRVLPDHVYIIPPNTSLAIARGTLRVMPRTMDRGLHMPVDVFLRSLAEDQKNKAIGVILSGTASDGALGLTAIKAGGGIAFAQDEQSAKYGGMPRSAVESGVVDFVLPPEGIARELERIGRHPYLTSPKAVAPEELLQEDRHSLGDVFDLLHKAFDTDFTEYKDTTIRLCIKRRMVLHKMEELPAYVQFLRKHPDEVEALYHDILINVTSFLRDPDAFDALKRTVFPAILKNHRQDAPLRVWVPGCATGEEAYSMAICLLEFLDTRGVAPQIQIFGTDVSQSAIERARTGTYLENIALDVSPERLRRFFVHLEGGRYQISKSVRDLCILAQHDLIKDAPFSRLDLISCRNVLIYLGPLLQRRILPIFHYALQPHGFLMLGSSETVGSFTQQFRLVDKKNKIYARQETAIRPRVDFPLVQGALGRVSGGHRKSGRGIGPEFDALKEADRIVQARYEPPGVLLNEAMEDLQFRGHTSDYLEPAPGTASFNVMKLAREGLLPDLSSAIKEARKSHSPVRREGIRVKAGDRFKTVDLSVHTIRAPHRAEKAFLVLFEESVALTAKSRGMRRSVLRTAGKMGALHGRQENEELRRELATNKEYLQSIVEEQEATNEELKTANEEILSSNEELQSTNEELETAKEELQSGNEELTTLNEELQNRNLELS